MERDSMMMLILLSSPAIVFPIHAVLCRTVRTSSRQKVAVGAIVLGYVPAGGLLWSAALGRLSGTGLLWAAGYCFAVYSLLGYCYFHFFNMSETARRIKILSMVHQAGSMSDRELESLYKTTDIVEARLERLTALGQVRCDEGRYFVEGRTLAWAGRIIVLWRRLLGFESNATESALLEERKDSGR